MRKKTIKIILITILFVLILFTIQNKAIASSVGEVIEGGSNFTGGANKEVINTTQINNVSNIIYNILLSIGIVAAVLVAAILGIQFMVGDVEGQAKVKESLIPFVLGCVIIFGAFGIWRMFAIIGQQI